MKEPIEGAGKTPETPQPLADAESLLDARRAEKKADSSQKTKRLVTEAPAEFTPVPEDEPLPAYVEFQEEDVETPVEPFSQEQKKENKQELHSLPDYDSYLSAQEEPEAVLPEKSEPTDLFISDEEPAAPATVAAVKAEEASVPEPQEAQAPKVVPANATASQSSPQTDSQQLVTAREKAVQDRPTLLKLRAVLMTLAVPLVIFALAARAIASTAFLWFEYHRPGFPADDYGFSTEERMRFGSYGVNYILNWAPSSYLREIRVNERTKLFLESEVEHMTDVKVVMLTGMALAAIFLVAALLSARTLTYRSPGTIRKSLFTGSLLTLLLMLTLMVTAFLGWDAFFTNFHHVLFPQGNWEFRMSDSLIRLYPPQFWVDAGIGFATLALALTGILLALTWPSKNRRAKAQLLRDFRDEQRKRLQG